MSPHLQAASTTLLVSGPLNNWVSRSWSNIFDYSITRLAGTQKASGISYDDDDVTQGCIHA